MSGAVAATTAATAAAAAGTSASTYMAGAGLGLSALQTLFGVLGSGNKQSDRAGQLQMQMMNYQLQKQYAEHQQRMAEAGRMDAAGNRVYFNGKDWVSEPTKATKAIIDASQANEREQQVSGGTRRELGQRQNFAGRLYAGNQASAYGRMLRDRVGAPTLEGIRGKNAVAAATRIGSKPLSDAIARYQLRSGTGNSSGAGPTDPNDEASIGNLRAALAENDAASQDKYRTAKDSWTAGNLNRFTPMHAAASNITDAAFAPTQVAAPIDTALNQAATYGAATSGRGAPAVNTAAGLMAASPSVSDISPWSNASATMSDAVMKYMLRNENQEEKRQERERLQRIENREAQEHARRNWGPAF